VLVGLMVAEIPRKDFLPQRRKDAKNKKFEARKRPRGPKHETRNKFECSKKQKISNNFNPDSAFWIFFGFGFIWRRFVSDFVLRISDFGASIVSAANCL